MKFLLISYSEIDGVGQHVINLNFNLKKMGHESKTILLHKHKSLDEDVIKIKRSFFFRVIFFILEFLKIKFKNLFSFGNSTIKYSSIKNYIDEADIIIIYSMHKILSFNMLEKIFKTNKIVYLRPLDWEFATGGCHLNILDSGKECVKLYDNCNKCPQLNFLNFFNLSRKILEKKRKILEKYKPKVFVENNYTKNIYNRSTVTKKLEIDTVFLGVNKERTSFFEKNYARENLNIDEKDKVILFGTFNMDAPHKGGRIIESILKIFISDLYSSEINKKKFNKIKLITFGRKNTFNLNVPNIEWIHLGEIHSNKKLNLLYRAADVFASPSTGCNGPHVILEALTNDLPVVAFDQGVAQDSVIDGVNGYLIPCFDKEVFASSIFKALFSNELVDEKKQHEKLKKVFNYSHEAKMIIENASKDLKNKINN